MHIDCKWLRMKSPAKWLCYHCISKMTKQQNRYHEAWKPFWLIISNLQGVVRLCLCDSCVSVCIFICAFCAAIEWQGCNWLNMYLTFIVYVLHAKTVLLIPQRLSLMPLIGWIRHTSGSLWLRGLRDDNIMCTIWTEHRWGSQENTPKEKHNKHSCRFRNFPDSKM